MRTLAIVFAATAALSLAAIPASARSSVQQAQTFSNGFKTCKVVAEKMTDDFGNTRERKTKVCRDGISAGGGGGGGFGDGSGRPRPRPRPGINVNINF